MGNIEADMYGKAEVEMVLAGRIVAEGPNGIIGRALIVHLSGDDLRSDPDGNSGVRIACGIIAKD
jgi:Cu-Zn family superoxide dismutase